MQSPYGFRCLLVDLNELFKSEKVHCPKCQVREKKVTRSGEQQTVKEYYHQAVALVWASGETPWPIGWELLRPGEGELTAAVRLLTRLLPRLRKSADLVMGLVLRSLAYCLTQAYFRFATGRSRDAPRFVRWFSEILQEDWVRYLDAAGAACPGRLEPRWSG